MYIEMMLVRDAVCGWWVGGSYDFLCISICSVLQCVQPHCTTLCINHLHKCDSVYIDMHTMWFVIYMYIDMHTMYITLM